jgi:hypothetical protein
VLLLGLEDRLEQLARDEVPERLAVADGSLELDVRRHLELEIALETFLHALADEQFSYFPRRSRPQLPNMRACRKY